MKLLNDHYLFMQNSLFLCTACVILLINKCINANCCIFKSQWHIANWYENRFFLLLCQYLTSISMLYKITSSFTAISLKKISFQKLLKLYKSFHEIKISWKISWTIHWALLLWRVEFLKSILDHLSHKIPNPQSLVPFLFLIQYANWYVHKEMQMQ